MSKKEFQQSSPRCWNPFLCFTFRAKIVLFSDYPNKIIKNQCLFQFQKFGYLPFQLIGIVRTVYNISFTVYKKSRR